VAFYSVGAWRCGLSRQAMAAVIEGFEVLCAWRYASPTRQSGSWQRLAVRVPRQAILLLQRWVVGSVSVLYKASGDVSKVELVVFLELSSERIP